VPTHKKLEDPFQDTPTNIPMEEFDNGDEAHETLDNVEYF
jgi:hypothetical protein